MRSPLEDDDFSLTDARENHGIRIAAHHKCIFSSGKNKEA
jgi:hypothetical protein